MNVPPQLLAALEREGLGLVEVHAIHQERGLPPALEDDEYVAAAALLLLERLHGERAAAQYLIGHHDGLREAHIKALTRLHTAHNVVGRAAITHRDSRLAVLARDELHGKTKAEAKASFLTGTALLRTARARYARASDIFDKAEGE